MRTVSVLNLLCYANCCPILSCEAWIVFSENMCGTTGTLVASDDDQCACECDSGWTGPTCACEGKCSTQCVAVTIGVCFFVIFITPTFASLNLGKMTEWGFGK